MRPEPYTASYTTAIAAAGQALIPITQIPPGARVVGVSIALRGTGDAEFALRHTLISLNSGTVYWPALAGRTINAAMVCGDGREASFLAEIDLLVDSTGAVNLTINNIHSTDSISRVDAAVFVVPA